MGMAIEMIITIIVITTINSTNVNPRSRFHARAHPVTGLPFCIGLSIGCLFLCLAVHVEYALTAPTLALGVVLVATHAPFSLPGERIRWDAPQEANLLTVRARQLHAFHQDVQRLGPVVAAEFLGAEIAEVGIVLVLVDGSPHLARSEERRVGK